MAYRFALFYSSSLFGDLALSGLFLVHIFLSICYLHMRFFSPLLLCYLCLFIPFPLFSLPALAALDDFAVVQREIAEVKNKLDQNSVHNAQFSSDCEAANFLSHRYFCNTCRHCSFGAFG